MTPEETWAEVERKWREVERLARSTRRWVLFTVAVGAAAALLTAARLLAL